MKENLFVNKFDKEFKNNEKVFYSKDNNITRNNEKVDVEIQLINNDNLQDRLLYYFFSISLFSIRILKAKLL